MQMEMMQEQMRLMQQMMSTQMEQNAQLMNTVAQLTMRLHDLSAQQQATVDRQSAAATVAPAPASPAPATPVPDVAAAPAALSAPAVPAAEPSGAVAVQAQAPPAPPAPAAREQSPDLPARTGEQASEAAPLVPERQGGRGSWRGGRGRGEAAPDTRSGETTGRGGRWLPRAPSQPTWRGGRGAFPTRRDGSMTREEGAQPVAATAGMDATAQTTAVQTAAPAVASPATDASNGVPVTAATLLTPATGHALLQPSGATSHSTPQLQAEPTPRQPMRNPGQLPQAGRGNSTGRGRGRGDSKGRTGGRFGGRSRQREDRRLSSTAAPVAEAPPPAVAAAVAPAASPAAQVEALVTPAPAVPAAPQPVVQASAAVPAPAVPAPPAHGADPPPLRSPSPPPPSVVAAHPTPHEPAANAAPPPHAPSPPLVSSPSPANPHTTAPTRPPVIKTASDLAANLSWVLDPARHASPAAASHAVEGLLVRARHSLPTTPSASLIALLSGLGTARVSLPPAMVGELLGAVLPSVASLSDPGLLLDLMRGTASLVADPSLPLTPRVLDPLHNVTFAAVQLRALERVAAWAGTASPATAAPVAADALGVVSAMLTAHPSLADVHSSAVQQAAIALLPVLVGGAGDLSNTQLLTVLGLLGALGMQAGDGTPTGDVITPLITALLPRLEGRLLSGADVASAATALAQLTAARGVQDSSLAAMHLVPVRAAGVAWPAVLESVSLDLLTQSELNLDQAAAVAAALHAAGHCPPAEWVQALVWATKALLPDLPAPAPSAASAASSGLTSFTVPLKGGAAPASPPNRVHIPPSPPPPAVPVVHCSARALSSLALCVALFATEHDLQNSVDSEWVGRLALALSAQHNHMSGPQLVDSLWAIGHMTGRPSPAAYKALYMHCVGHMKDLTPAQIARSAMLPGYMARDRIAHPDPALVLSGKWWEEVQAAVTPLLEATAATGQGVGGDGTALHGPLNAGVVSNMVVAASGTQGLPITGGGGASAGYKSGKAHGKRLLPTWVQALAAATASVVHLWDPVRVMHMMHCLASVTHEAGTPAVPPGPAGTALFHAYEQAAVGAAAEPRAAPLEDLTPDTLQWIAELMHTARHTPTEAWQRVWVGAMTAQPAEQLGAARLASALHSHAVLPFTVPLPREWLEAAVPFLSTPGYRKASKPGQLLSTCGALWHADVAVPRELMDGMMSKMPGHVPNMDGDSLVDLLTIFGTLGADELPPALRTEVQARAENVMPTLSPRNALLLANKVVMLCGPGKASEALAAAVGKRFSVLAAAVVHPGGDVSPQVAADAMALTSDGPELWVAVIQTMHTSGYVPTAEHVQLYLDVLAPHLAAMPARTLLNTLANITNAPWGMPLDEAWLGGALLPLWLSNADALPPAYHASLLQSLLVAARVTPSDGNLSPAAQQLTAASVNALHKHLAAGADGLVPLHPRTALASSLCLWQLGYRGQELRTALTALAVSLESPPPAASAEQAAEDGIDLLAACDPSSEVVLKTVLDIVQVMDPDEDEEDATSAPDPDVSEIDMVLSGGTVDLARAREGTSGGSSDQLGPRLLAAWEPVVMANASQWTAVLLLNYGLLCQRCDHALSEASMHVLAGRLEQLQGSLAEEEVPVLLAYCAELRALPAAAPGLARLLEVAQSALSRCKPTKLHNSAAALLAVCGSAASLGLYLPKAWQGSLLYGTHMFARQTAAEAHSPKYAFTGVPEDVLRTLANLMTFCSSQVSPDLERTGAWYTSVHGSMAAVLFSTWPPGAREELAEHSRTLGYENRRDRVLKLAGVGGKSGSKRSLQELLARVPTNDLAALERDIEAEVERELANIPPTPSAPQLQPLPPALVAACVLACVAQREPPSVAWMDTMCAALAPAVTQPGWRLPDINNLLYALLQPRAVPYTPTAELLAAIERASLQRMQQEGQGGTAALAPAVAATLLWGQVRHGHTPSSEWLDTYWRLSRPALHLLTSPEYAQKLGAAPAAAAAGNDDVASQLASLSGGTLGGRQVVTLLCACVVGGLTPDPAWLAELCQVVVVSSRGFTHDELSMTVCHLASLIKRLQGQPGGPQEPVNSGVLDALMMELLTRQSRKPGFPSGAAQAGGAEAGYAAAAHAVPDARQLDLMARAQKALQTAMH